MTQIHEFSALELADLVRRRELSPTEVVEHALARLDRLDARLGAFVTVTPELARAHAAEVEQALTDAADDDAPTPPLAGVPCPIKDLAMVAGVPFRAGSAALEGTIAPADDGVVTLLRDAGTLMLGKTNTPEFGLPPYTEPDIAPPARTPWDPSRTAGGSSGGAAAAVAAGIAPVAHASDGGGSIRIPASACGLVGLKPTRGRISPGPYGTDGAGLASNGVLTRDIRDTAALLDVLARPWAGDVFTLPGPRTTFLDACGRDPGRLRVGVLTTPVIDADAPVDDACVAAVARTAALLEELGHDVEEAPVPFPAERWASFDVLWSVLSLTAPVEAEAERLLVPLTRWLREKGRSVSGVDYASAISLVQSTTRESAATWAPYDVVVTPTLARPPARVGELRDDDDPAADFAAQMAFTPWTSVWNLTGWPAVSLPLEEAEVDGVRLPVGVMLGGRQGGEETLLALSSQLEQARPWRDRHPPDTEW
ncbi:amidase [Haloactinopolyspora alba]|uniref:amidase n=1 Tax=Haloactinopolyspora alba TaxID=648780 RepID=UPI00197AF596|nr:amidase [Haloactinopolyspora alba]